MIKYPDYIFKCKKCSHNLYADKENIDSLLTMDCPECGEEAGGLWILEDEGDFENR